MEPRYTVDIRSMRALPTKRKGTRKQNDR